MRLSTFYRKSFSGPLPTTQADRPALPTDSFGPPLTPVSRNQSSLRLHRSLENRFSTNEPVWKGCARQCGFPRVSALARLPTRVIPLPLRPTSVRSHGLRIRRACTAVKIDSGIAWCWVPSSRPPAASSQNNSFGRPWGGFHGAPRHKAFPRLQAVTALFRVATGWGREMPRKPDFEWRPRVAVERFPASTVVDLVAKDGSHRGDNHIFR